MASGLHTDIKVCSQKPSPALEKAIVLKPDFPDALMQLGYVYRETERFPEALEAFTTITEIYPNSAKAYHELGVCHTKQGTYPEAIKAFERALQLNPDAQLRRGICYKLPKRVSHVRNNIAVA